MIVLTIRSDNPMAEVALYDGNDQLARQAWEAHRILAETIHIRIESLLKGVQKDWKNIEGIVCFAGPGSFTGLRIGLSVGNALAYGLSVPIVTAKGTSWTDDGITRLLKGDASPTALPEYGAEAHITQQRK